MVGCASELSMPLLLLLPALLIGSAPTDWNSSGSKS
jgi:hypothetical protein